MVLFDLINCPRMAASEDRCISQGGREQVGSLFSARRRGQLRARRLMAHSGPSGTSVESLSPRRESHFCGVLGIPLGDNKMDLWVFSLIPIG